MAVTIVASRSRGDPKCNRKCVSEDDETTTDVLPRDPGHGKALLPTPAAAPIPPSGSLVCGHGRVASGASVGPPLRVAPNPLRSEKQPAWVRNVESEWNARYPPNDEELHSATPQSESLPSDQQCLQPQPLPKRPSSRSEQRTHIDSHSHQAHTLQNNKQHTGSREQQAAPPGSMRSPPQRRPTLEGRINAITSKLSDMGLIPLQAAQLARRFNSDLAPTAPAPNSNAEPYHHFIHTLQSMHHSLSDSASGSDRNTQSLALNGLLAMVEGMLDEATHLSNECDYWQTKHNQTSQYLDRLIAEHQTSNKHTHKDDALSFCSKSVHDVSTSTSDDLSKCNGLHSAVPLSADVSTIYHQQAADMRTIKQNNELLQHTRTNLTHSDYLGNGLAQTHSAPGLFNAYNETSGVVNRDFQHHLLMLQDENKYLRRSVQELDATRQKLESELNRVLYANRVTVQKEVDAARTHDRAATHDLQRREQELHAALATNGIELELAKQSVHHLQRELESLNHMTKSKCEALERAEESLSAMNREGQAVAVENSRLQSELLLLRQRREEDARRADQAEHFATIAEQCKSELAARYRTTVEERDRFERELDAALRNKAELIRDLEMHQEERNRLEGQLQSLGSDMQRRVSEAESLERDLQKSHRHAHALKQTLESTEEENRRLRDELAVSRQSVGATSKQRLDLQRTAAKAQHDVEAYQEMVSELENEQDLLRRMLENERSRLNDLENLLSSARAKDAAASDQIRKLARENAQLTTKVNEANARLGRGLSSPFQPSRGSKMSSSPALSKVIRATTHAFDRSLVQKLETNIDIDAMVNSSKITYQRPVSKHQRRSFENANQYRSIIIVCSNTHNLVVH